MATKLRFNTKELQIYRETNSVMRFTLFMAFSSIVFGFWFLYIGFLGNRSYAHVIGGCVFSLAGLALLMWTIKSHKKMKENKGFTLLSTTENGLLLAPSIGMDITLYKWSEITKIVITKLLIDDRSDDGIGRLKNVAIIFFQRLYNNFSVIENSKRGIIKTPENNYVIIVDLPKGELFTIQQKLKYFTPKKINIGLFDKVEFIYKRNNRSETFH